MSIIILSIRFALTGAVGNEGNATLTNVSIKQAGTGQSVVIKGETLDEITLNQEAGYGTDDASRRIILNNNVVRYEATYNVTSPGIIELSITLPANNTIDEATIGSAQQCMNGSKLESADITNSDGTITKSYTNNKATCIRNITSPGSTNWNITAYPWGSNNEQITPTLAINNQAQDTKPEPITVVGRGNYSIEANVGQNEQASSDGVVSSFYVSLYASVENNNKGALGISPLDNNTWTIPIDMSDFTDKWSITKITGITNFSNAGSYSNGVVHAGSANVSVDEEILNVTVSNAIAGTHHCPVKVNAGDNIIVDTDKCYFSGFTIKMVTPVDSLSSSSIAYKMIFNNFDVSVNNRPSQVLTNQQELVFNLSSQGFGNPRLWALWMNKDDYVGWSDFWDTQQPIYIGERIKLGAWLQINAVPGQSMSTNLNYCVSWDPSLIDIREEFFEADQEDISSSAYPPIMLSDYKAQYGIIGTDMSVLPSSSQQYCGKVGDENIPGQMMFFDTLEEANTYAKQNGLAVNAMRLWSAETEANIRDGRLGGVEMISGANNALENKLVNFNTSATTDQWTLGSDGKSSDNPYRWGVTLTPGLLSHTITAEPSSTNPGKEDHITITTKTYNKDTNAKITVNLPIGLSIKPGTITIKDPNTGNPIPLIEGETSDYTVSLNATNATATTTTTPTSSTTSDDANPTNTTKLTNGSTITFNLDNIATNHGINLTGYEPIYPGESGVTNIECNATSNTTSSTTSSTASNATSNSDTNPTCHEVITTNNNNTDDDPINDDLPIAADNNGNGIEHTHTPIEFDVVIDEDTPAPSTITINSTASGTGTDYARSTFKSASDTITVADPPRTFGYDLTTSSNYVYAGDNLTYNYQVSNLTNNEVTNLDLVTVLPYNDDSRGTAGLIDPATPATNPYTLTNLTTSLPDGAHLYYTIDTTAVRQIEQGKDTSALISDPSIIWQELDSNTIPTDIASKITALRLSIDNFAMDSKANFSITLTNILANNPTTDLQPSLASDITYLGYQAAGIPTLTSHTNLVKTSYEGNLLVLNPDKTTITTNLNPNEVKLGNGNVDNPDSLTNRLDITARTLNGYTVTMQVKGSSNSLLPVSTNNASNANNTNDTNDNTNRLIPAINTTPTAGLTGWAISLDTTNADPTWQAVPAIDSDTDQPTLPLSIYQTDGNGPKSLRLPIAYGVSTSQNTIADTYRAEVVYTLTAEL